MTRAEVLQILKVNAGPSPFGGNAIRAQIRALCHALIAAWDERDELQARNDMHDPEDREP